MIHSSIIQNQHLLDIAGPNLANHVKLDQFIAINYIGL